VIFLIVGYVLLFGYLSLAQHLALKTQLNDLGNMVQPLFNTLEGRFMQSSNYTVSDQYEVNRFGIHANFILLLLFPLYALVQDPSLLLVVQTLAIGFGALPLYWLARDCFREDARAALVPPILYLANPLVQDTNLYDFHPLALAMPLILFAFYFAYRRRYLLFVLFAALLALTKEDMPLIVAMLGLYVFFVQRDKGLGITVVLVALAYFFCVVQLLMPMLNRGAETTILSNRYGHLGNSVGDILVNIVRSPHLLLGSLVSATKGIYLTALLLPVLFLPLLAPQVLLLSAPTLLINLLANNSAMHYPLQFYYSAPILAFVFLATVVALGSVKSRFAPVVFRSVVVTLLFASSAVSFALSPAPYSLLSSWAEFSIPPQSANVRALAQRIPGTASLSIQNNLGPHFAHREKVYSFPHMSAATDYVVVDTFDPNPVVRFEPRMRNFEFNTQMRPQAYYDAVVAVFNDCRYGVTSFSEDGLIVFRREAGREGNAAARDLFERNLDRLLARGYRQRFGSVHRAALSVAGCR